MRVAWLDLPFGLLQCQSRRSGTAGTVFALYLATCNLLRLGAFASMWRPWQQQGSRPHNIAQRPLVDRFSGGVVNRQSERGCSSAVWLKPAQVERTNVQASRLRAPFALPASALAFLRGLPAVRAC